MKNRASSLKQSLMLLSRRGNRVQGGAGNGEDGGGGKGIADAGQLIRRNVENIAAHVEMHVAHLEAQVKQMFDGLDDVDGAEEVPFDELVRMQGPMFHLVENAIIKKSESGKRARASHKYNHTDGSRSYALRSSMEAAKNGGVRPSMTGIFEITYKRHRHGGVWINELAEQDHALLKEKIDAQSQPNTENPQTEVQISVEVLGKRSSFSRGFGKIKTTSSSRQSQATSHELTALQKKFADEQKLDDQQQKLADQDNTLMEWRGLLQMMAAKFGMDPSTVPGLVIHNGVEDHTSSGGHDATSLG